MRNLRHVRTVRLLRRNVAVVAVGFAAVLVGSAAVPAYAQATATVTPAYVAPELQHFAAPASLPAQVVERNDTYSVTVPPALQWPVGAGSPISDGFGPRVSPCSGCSSMHEGVDFDPGYGATVRAIAAGVVVETNNPGYAALGIHVAIEHVIDGQTIVSAYGHMQTGSMHLKVGDIVYVGQPIGLVGSTGASTGAHLHFEIRKGGTTPIDPLAWMHAHLG